MPFTDDPVELQRRAVTARRVGQQLLSLDVHALLRAGGGDTWCGPRANQFLADARVVMRLVERAADELLLVARRLDGDAVDAAARDRR